LEGTVIWEGGSLHLRICMKKKEKSYQESFHASTWMSSVIIEMRDEKKKELHTDPGIGPLPSASV